MGKEFNENFSNGERTAKVEQRNVVCVVVGIRLSKEWYIDVMEKYNVVIMKSKRNRKSVGNNLK